MEIEIEKQNLFESFINYKRSEIISGLFTNVGQENTTIEKKIANQTPFIDAQFLTLENFKPNYLNVGQENRTMEIEIEKTEPV